MVGSGEADRLEADQVARCARTAATLMLRAGVPVKVVSERIGHADVTVTLGIYQHVTKRDDQAAADVLGGLLRPSVITQ